MKVRDIWDLFENGENVYFYNSAKDRIFEIPMDADIVGIRSTMKGLNATGIQILLNLETKKVKYHLSLKNLSELRALHGSDDPILSVQFTKSYHNYIEIGQVNLIKFCEFLSEAHPDFLHAPTQITQLDNNKYDVCFTDYTDEVFVKMLINEWDNWK